MSIVDLLQQSETVGDFEGALFRMDTVTISPAELAEFGEELLKRYAGISTDVYSLDRKTREDIGELFGILFTERMVRKASDETREDWRNVLVPQSSVREIRSILKLHGFPNTESEYKTIKAQLNADRTEFYVPSSTPTAIFYDQGMLDPAHKLHVLGVAFGLE